MPFFSHFQRRVSTEKSGNRQAALPALNKSKVESKHNTSPAAFETRCPLPTSLPVTQPACQTSQLLRLPSEVLQPIVSLSLSSITRRPPYTIYDLPFDPATADALNSTCSRLRREVLYHLQYYDPDPWGGTIWKFNQACSDWEYVRRSLGRALTSTKSVISVHCQRWDDEILPRLFLMEVNPKAYPWLGGGPDASHNWSIRVHNIPCPVSRDGTMTSAYRQVGAALRKVLEPGETLSGPLTRKARVLRS